ncbi:hypothetical protein [Brevibacillus daliensis]|uniref:hypothetical protein n=1 Tax=Brevibacillus daliensis TaxID=2892995 RepID=UPI001E2D78A0|nr:hypothetical protein [Brevibacillus daliensis]
MDQAYLERVTHDLATRVTSLIVNNQTVRIRSSVENGTTLTVITEPVRGIERVSSLKLLDERGQVIIERTADLFVLDDQSLEFRFEMNVRGER